MNTPHRILTGSVSALLRKSHLVLAAVSLGFAASAAAQSITWGSATTMSADADVITTGALDRAYIFGSAGAVNGVTFSNFQGNPLGDSTGAGMVNYPGGAYAANGSAFPNYGNLSTAYKDIARFGVFTNGVGGSLTLNGLNSGLEYQLQVWVNDSRDCCSGRTETIGGMPTTLAFNAQNGSGGVGQFAVGTFTGTNPSTTLTVSANASAQINALNLRATGVGAANTATITAPQDWSGLTLGAASLLKYDLSTNSTQGTAISGSGALEKTGTGTLILTGALSYGGATNITGGILRIVGVATSAVSGAARQFDASTLGLADGANVTQWNDLSGNGANATTPGDQSNTNPTFVANGGMGTGLGVIHFNAGGGATSSQALTYSRDTNVRSYFSIFKGASFLATDTQGYALHRPGDSNPADALLADYGQVNYLGTAYVNGTAVNATGAAMPTTAHNGFNQVSLITNGNPFALDGFNRDRIYHSGDQSQAEVLIYDFVLSEGQRLQNESYLSHKWFGTGAAASLPATTPVTITNGGTLDLVGPQTIGSLSSTDGLGSKVIINGSLTAGDSASTTFDGVISGLGSFTKTGNGTLTLTGTSTHTGGSTISSGTLKAGSNQALGAFNNAVTVNGGATLDLGNAELFNYTTPITINGSGVGGVGAIYKSTPGNGALLQLRGIVLGSDASIGGVATSRIDIGRSDWTGPGPGAPIHINGQGHTLSVVGGTYLGILAEATNLAGVRIATGASVAPHNDASFASATVTLDGGTLTPWNNHTFSNNLVVTSNGGFIDNQGFSQTYTGTVQVNGPTQINTIVGGNITLAGNVSGNGAITKIGGYSLFLSGDNNGYTGTFTASQSNTIFTSDTAGSANAAFVVNSSLFNAQAGNHSVQLGSLAGSGVVSNSLANPDSGEVTFIIGGKNTPTTYSGAIINTNYQAGTSRIRKVGTAALTLDGTLAYTGVTDIDSGTLNVNSALGAGANIVNANGGTTNFGVSETLGELNIGNGAVVTLGAAAPAPAPLLQGVAAVPEPGTASLLLLGVLGMLGRRRRSA